MTGTRLLIYRTTRTSAAQPNLTRFWVGRTSRLSNCSRRCNLPLQSSSSSSPLTLTVRNLTHGRADGVLHIRLASPAQAGQTSNISVKKAEMGRGNPFSRILGRYAAGWHARMSSRFAGKGACACRETGFQHPALAVAPSGHRRDDMTQSRPAAFMHLPARDRDPFAFFPNAHCASGG